VFHAEFRERRAGPPAGGREQREHRDVQAHLPPGARRERFAVGPRARVTGTARLPVSVLIWSRCITLTKKVTG
jgi:hypothetical protein